MPSIHLTTSHSLGTATAKKRVETVAQQLKSRLGVDYRWDGNTLKFERAGASGSILVEETSVTADVELGLMLSAFKGEVQKQLKGYLEENLR